MTTSRTLAILVMAGLGSTAAAAPTKPSKKQQEIEKHEWMAQYYLRRAADYAGAAKEYQAILALDPENADASVALASIYLHDKKEKLAVDVLTKLTKKNPKNAEAWITLAELEAQTGDDKGLRTAIDKASAIDPSNVRVYSILFERSEKRLKDGDQAAKPDALDAARKIMMLSRRQGPEYKQAERAVVELSGDPMELTIYDAKAAYSSAFDQGMIGDINRQMTKARQGFLECTRSQPANEDCHYYLGLVYSSVKASDSYDLKKGLTELALAPKMANAWVETGKILRSNDKNDDARTALTKALAIDAKSAAAHVELGILDKVAGKTDSAAEQFVAAMDLDPYGADGDRALNELAKVKPSHPRVAEGMMEGKRGGDIFASDRFKAVLPLIEAQLGGVEKDAPEQAVLEEIVRRLSEGSNVKEHFHVQLVATHAVNAFALGDGSVYVTRGLLDMMKKKQPSRAIDANNDALGHILGHELQHVIRRHTVNSSVFQEAYKDASRPLDPSVVTHVTRLNEMDADRQGMVMAFLAGYHPRGGIEFMEIMGQESEIPPHLDHPTFQERVDYLTEWWTNDVRYAFVSFKLGVAAMDRGAKLEASDMKAAVTAYEEAVEDFKRYRTMLPNLKEAMNDLGVAYTKIGVLAMPESPLGRWQSRYSVERDSAVKYVNLARPDGEAAPGGTTRGAVQKVPIPWQLREAISQLKEAIATDENYSKARLNLASAYLAANQLDNATSSLGKSTATQGVVAGDIELIRGIVLAEGKDYDRAKASFDKAIGSQAAKRAASYNLAKTLELAGKKDEAKRAYQQYSKLYPGGPWAKAADTAAAKL